MRMITIAFSHFLFVIFCLFFSVALRATEVCGRVESVTGKVELLHIKAGERDKAEPTRLAEVVSKSVDILCDDLIVTSRSSRAKVRLGAALITLSPNSRISILSLSKMTKQPSAISLTYGKIRTFFKTDREKVKDFEVKTPSATIGVRGTDFFVSHDLNTVVTEQATISGKVEVVQTNSGQSAIVESGKQVVVENVPPPPPLVEKAPEKPAEKAKDTVASTPSPVVMEAKLLVVIDIQPRVIDDIKQTSVLAKAEPVFASPEAVKILGKPETWVPPQDEVPYDLQEIRNEF